jgi:hypothetical protein
MNNGTSGAPEGWSADYFAVKPEPRRPLTQDELNRLVRLGFTALALDLAAGTCETCGLNRRSKAHMASCLRPEVAKPTPAQPWEPRPARNRAA